MGAGLHHVPQRGGSMGEFVLFVEESAKFTGQVRMTMDQVGGIIGPAGVEPVQIFGDNFIETLLAIHVGSHTNRHLSPRPS